MTGENRSSVTSRYAAEAQYLRGFGELPEGRRVQTLTSLLLEQGDVDVIVDALQKQLPFVCNELLPLGGPQGAHQRLEDVGTPVVIE